MPRDPSPAILELGAVDSDDDGGEDETETIIKKIGRAHV